MYRPHAFPFVLICGLCCWGCGGERRAHPLDPELARTSLQAAMEAWADGLSPQELQPEIIVGDPRWEQGQQLASFEVLPEEETTDGSNLYIRVKRTFSGGAQSKATYIVGTSPVITIFPQ